MSSSDLQLKFIKFFYGLGDEVDEFAEKQLTTFGNNMYMIASFGGFVSWVLSITFNYDLLSIFICGIFLYSQIKQENLIKKLGLDIIEVAEEEFSIAKKKMIRRTIFQLLFSVILSILVLIGLIKGGYFAGVTIDFQDKLFIAGCTGALMCLLPACIVIYKNNLKKIIVIEE